MTGKQTGWMNEREKNEQTIEEPANELSKERIVKRVNKQMNKCMNDRLNVVRANPKIEKTFCYYWPFTIGSCLYSGIDPAPGSVSALSPTLYPHLPLFYNK